MGDELHPERLQQAEQLGADIADADRAECAPDEADAHMLAPPGKACRTLARQSVLDHQLAGERQHQRDDGHSHRPADAIRRDDEGDAGLGASLDIHGVVADAEAGHHGEPSIGMDALLREAMREEDQGVEIGELVRPDRVRGLEISEFHISRAAQRLEVEIGKDGGAVGFAEIARESDAIGRAHDFFPPRLVAQPARNLLIASARASCSTQTSPE